jgi:hypothetical protein
MNKNPFKKKLPRLGFNTSGMRLKFLTLTFIDEPSDEPGGLEKQYLEDHYLKYINQSRAAVFLAIIFYALFGILDALLLPEITYLMHSKRYDEAPSKGALC